MNSTIFQGGSSTPGLPVWTFQASDSSTPESGKFTTDNSDPSMVGQIMLSNTSKGNLIDLSGFLSLFTFTGVVGIQLVDSSGKPLIYGISVSSGQGGFFNLAVTGLVNDSVPLSGDYSISFPLANLGLFPVLTQGYAQSSITPIADGTYFGITFKNGIAISAATPQSDGTITPVTSITFGSGGAILSGA